MHPYISQIEDKLKSSLTPYQRLAYKAVRWLVSSRRDDRATGRSYLMAAAFVVEAMEQPGTWVYIFDHHPFPLGGRENMVRSIWSVLHKVDDTKIGQYVAAFLRDGEASFSDLFALRRDGALMFLPDPPGEVSASFPVWRAAWERDVTQEGE